MTMTDKIKLYADQEIPIKISWSSAEILKFLNEQNLKGNEEAFTLLYLALHIKIRSIFLKKTRTEVNAQDERLDVISSDLQDKIVHAVESEQEFPESVRRAVVCDLQSGVLTLEPLLSVQKRHAVMSIENFL